MLRQALIGATAVVLAWALALAALGRTPLWPTAIWSGVVLAALILERCVYKPIRRDRPGAGWIATAERFVDPVTGCEVQVFFRPDDAQRQYVRADRPRI